MSQEPPRKERTHDYLHVVMGRKDARGSLSQKNDGESFYSFTFPHPFQDDTPIPSRSGKVEV